MNQQNIDALVRESLAIEVTEAKEAGALGYMARALTQATMPHKATEGNEFERRNGAFTLTMFAPSKVGLPYGAIPRLLIAWLTTEAVRTKSAHLQLGTTLSGFMAELGMLPHGGRWGNITRLKTQTNRLFQCMVSCDYALPEGQGGEFHNEGYRIAKASHLWWHPTNPDQAPLWNSSVTLSGDFYDEVVNNPVPIDMRALKALKGSAMALDIYCWLTYRNSYLKSKTSIPWQSLQMQFGAGYPMNTAQGKRSFKYKFCEQLKKIRVIYPDALIEVETDYLVLKPSPTHVGKIL